MPAISDRAVRAVAGALALLGISGSPAMAQTVRSTQAPAAWVAYAQRVNQEIAQRLSSNDPIAARLHAYLDQLPGETAEGGVRLPISVWINAKGVIAKVDFRPFADAQPNADLHALLEGRGIAALPPKGMLLPIRLTVRLDPTGPENEPAGASI